MIFRQLFDEASSTYTYLVADPGTKKAALVDPVFEQARRDTALVRELGLELAHTLETHVHADHVTAAWILRRGCDSKIVVSARAGASGADVTVDHGDRIDVGEVAIEVRATPGHTDGCVTYVLHEQRLAFTGDALLIRGAGRTDFQRGDAAKLFRSVRERIFSLPDDYALYPAHDYGGRTSTTVGEEKVYNPRLGGERSEADFVGYMEALGLSHPKQIEVAVPANLRCGQPEDPSAVPVDPDWAPVVYTYAGVYEIDPEWVAEHLTDVQLLDVRSHEEYDGELGHVEGAKLLPLDELRDRVSEIDRERPVVTICRSGGRSAQAAVILRAAGFERVANLAGGMLRWRART